MATLAHSDEHGLWMHFARFEGPKVGSPDVILIPMIHVANRDFLQEAYEETWRYDFALYEGAYVPMTSVFRHIYPVLAKVLGLTPQGSGKISLERQGWKRQSDEAARERIMVKTFNRSDLQLSRRQKQIIADMDKKGFSESVKDMPLSAKLAFPFLLVGFLFAAPFTFKREDFFTLSEDTPDVESSNFFERCFGHYFKYILEDRDEFLKLTFRNQFEICHGHDLSICVQYGQRHMKALVDFLQDEMGYRLAEKREVLAVSKTKKMSLKGLQTGYGQAFAAYKFLPSNMSEEHQKYDRKMTSVESRKAALDKMSARRVARESVRLAQSSYAFSKDDIMNAWTACASGGAMGYNLLVGRKKLVSDEDLQLDNLNDVEGYSLDVKYSKPSYSIRNSKPGSSPEYLIKIDDSLVFVVKPNKDAA